jgi:hypothetical protein
VRYLGGEAGLYLATDDMMARLNWVNLALVLAAILVCCAIVFRSPAAGLLFAVACVMANFGAFLYMNALTMGLTVDTIAVISLGIGLGIDYAIYTVARIRDEVIEGARAERCDSYRAAHHGRMGVCHVRSGGRRDAAVGILAPAVPQRDELAADFADERQSDCGPVHPARVHRMAPLKIHYALRICRCDRQRARGARRPPRALTERKSCLPPSPA